MGSVGVMRERGQTDLEFFRSEWVGGDHGEILAGASVRGVFYGAWKLGATHGPDEGKVVAIVSPFSRGRDGYFTYKCQDETMGPYDAEAPARILDMLSPTDDENSNTWRATCRANLEKKAAAKAVQPGMTVRFSSPIEFTNGVTADTFTFVKRNTFIHNFQRYSISNWKTRTYEVVS